MATQLAMVTIVVKDYDEAIAFYTEKLDFILIENTHLTESKRWLVVAPDASNGSRILLAKADNEKQMAVIGNQTGGRVEFFLSTDDFEKTYQTYLDKGIKFVRQPVKESYGTVAVFEDLYGNKWDLIGLEK